MSFGGVARFRISERELSYESAKALHDDKGLWHRGYNTGANISDSRPDRSHYWIVERHATHPLTNQYESCYSLLMYRTHIHTWFKDGTYESINYSSAITRTVLSTFGPVRVWSDSRLPFYCKDRFGTAYSHTNSYPYGGGIVVDPEGWVRNLRDFKDVMKPEAKKERAVIRKRFRDNAVHRIMLGEFGDAFVTYANDVRKGFGRWETGWMARVPTWYSGVATAFYGDADHAPLQELIDRAQWINGPVRPSRDLAMLAAVNGMADMLLDSSAFSWHKKTPVEYGDINVRGE